MIAGKLKHHCHSPFLSSSPSSVQSPFFTSFSHLLFTFPHACLIQFLPRSFISRSYSALPLFFLPTSVFPSPPDGISPRLPLSLPSFISSLPSASFYPFFNPSLLHSFLYASIPSSPSLFLLSFHPTLHSLSLLWPVILTLPFHHVSQVEPTRTIRNRCNVYPSPFLSPLSSYVTLSILLPLPPLLFFLVTCFSLLQNFQGELISFFLIFPSHSISFSFVSILQKTLH